MTLRPWTGLTLADHNFHRDNHYVPCVYLKSWALSPKQVWTYPTLVAHEKVPLWRKRSVRGVAYYAHLYTRIVAGQESDEIEKWLDQEYEAPAEEAIQKATSDARLTPCDWRNLVRFLAAQDVRTPARLVENLQRWHTTMPELLENTLQETLQKLELARTGLTELPQAQTPFTEYFPVRVSTEIEPDQEFGKLKAEIIASRGAWLFSIRHLLSKTANVLHQHKWTILSPPKDMSWFTSDDPVIRLNYSSLDQYDFRGGWGSTGTEIFLPLGPRHLLYTQVGKRTPRRGTQFSREQAELIRRLIAEHSHRMIIAEEPDTDVPKLRPRTVSAACVQDEHMQWTMWHKDQTAAERALMGWPEE